ncbi:MAG: hypothetical protein ACLPYZ_09450, partial [Limisphaerales bacterium]
MSDVLNEARPTKDDAALSELVDFLKKSYGTRADMDATLERRIAGLTPEKMLITGKVADRLIFTKPYMFPKKVWGGGIGFRSSRRMNRLLELLGIAPGTFPTGDLFLLRFQIASQDWVPHPYNVPHWALASFGVFSRIRNDKVAFSICNRAIYVTPLATTNRISRDVRGLSAHTAGNGAAFQRRSGVPRL